MNRLGVLILFIFSSLGAFGQVGAVQGFATQGGVPAKTSGMPSANTLQGVIPSATITVYLHGTTNRVTIYANSSMTPLANPFTANAKSGTNPGGWIFWASTSQELDVMGSGGICPNCYGGPTPLAVGVYPAQIGGGAGSGITQLTGDVLAGPGTGSQSATVAGLTGIPFCAGFTPTDGQDVQLTTASSPNPCWTSAAGGTSYPITYTCTGNATTDLTAINGYLATSGTYLYLFGNCATNNQIILFSGDTLAWTGQTLTSSMPYSPDGNGVDEAAITNEAIVNPTYIGPLSCALTAGSIAVTCSTASFTNADLDQSFVCTGALGGGVDLHTSINYILSGTSLELVDPAGSTITSENFNCTEQIRDHDIKIIAGTLSMTSVYTTPFESPHELLIGHVNRLEVEDGYWVEPDGSSNWHMAIFDATSPYVHGSHHYSNSGFEQDGIHFLGPARNISVDSIVCYTYDDCVTLQTSLLSGTFHNTNGSISSWLIHNIQGGSSSAGVSLYDDCVNASGTCINSPLTNGVIDTVLAGPEAGNYNGIGFIDPVRLGYGQEAASDVGTVAQIDDISINHIKGANYFSEDQIVIGGANSANEYYGSIFISDVAPIVHASGGNCGAVVIKSGANPSYSLNINTLAISSLGYKSIYNLINQKSPYYSITNLLVDTPNLNFPALSGTITNKYIGGILIPGTTPLMDGTNTYLLYDNNHFLGEEIATTNILTDWNLNTGSASANQMIPFCSSVASITCTGFSLNYLETGALVDWTNTGAINNVPICTAASGGKCTQWTPGAQSGGMTYPGANTLGVGNSGNTAWRTPLYSDITALWASGSCSGYLKSDNTCSIPSSMVYPSAGYALSNGSAWVAGSLSESGSGTINASEPISISGSTHGITIPAGTAVSGAANSVIYASDATNGYAEANENNTGLSRICTAANGICQAPGTYALQVGGSGLTAGDTVNFNNTTPTAEANSLNIHFQTSKASTTDSISGEIVGDGTVAHYLNGTGGWSTPAGSGGTVTVVSSGNLTSTALVTGGGSQALQTPSTTSTLDASGNLAVAAGGSIGSADSGAPKFTFATNKATFNQPLYLGTTSNQFVTGTSSNLTTLTFPAPSGGITLTFPLTSEYMVGVNSDTTTTHVLHATGVAGVANSAAIATGDLPTIPIAGGGTNATSAASAGLIPNTSSTTASSWTATPTLGLQATTAGSLTIAGTTGTSGSLVLNGSSSGSATINTSSTGVLALPSGTTATSMSLTTPSLGVATATTINKVTLTAPASGSTLTIADGQTLTDTYSMNVSKTAGVAGAIPWYDTTTTESASALLTQYGVMVGGGASAAPSTIAASVTTTQALFATETAPAFRAIAAGDLPSIPLSGVVSATGAIATIADGNYPLVINCALTSGATCLTTGETSAATTAGAVEHQITTLTTSTAIPLQITQGAVAPATSNAPAVFNISAAAAGATASSHVGYVGAPIGMLTGAGSAGNGASNNGGAAGDFTLTTAAGGTSGGASATGGRGGNINLNTGAGGGANGGTAGAAGQVLISSAGGTAYPAAVVICTGAVALTASGNSIASGAYYGASASTPQTITCTGATSADNVQLDFATDPTGQTGFGPSATGVVVTIVKYLTTNTINIKVENNSASSITPAAINLNYIVTGKPR